MSKPTHVVKHRNLYFTVALADQKKAEFQHVPEGTQLVLTEKQANGFMKRGMVGKIGGDVATMAEDVASLRARAAELNIEGSSKWGEKRLVEEIAKAEAAIDAANAAAS